MLSREQILAAADIRFEDVGVPEWGGTVRVKMMSGLERNRMETMLRDRRLDPDSADMRAIMVAMAVVDDAGALLFTPADIEALGRKSWVALERVAEAVARVNALTDATVEAIAKN